MTDYLNFIEIIHARPAEMAVADGEASGLDDGGIDPQTGAHAQHGPAILGDVGLEKGKGEGHGAVLAPKAALAKCLWA